MRGNVSVLCTRLHYGRTSCSVIMAVVCLVALLVPLHVCASAFSPEYPIISSNAFDSSLHGWGSSNAWSVVSRPTSGGVGDSGWMQTSWASITNTNPNDPEYSSLFFTAATNLFTGDWSTNYWFAMDFWASNNSPSAVQVQWWAEGSNRVWRNTVFDDLTDDMAQTNWTGIASADLQNSTNWGLPFWTQDQFLDDLASIDWIGVQIWRGDMGESVYGIDDFNLMVPEPAEVILLIFAGISSFMTLRRKRKRVLDTDDLTAAAASST